MIFLQSIWKWILQTASRMCYGVISAKPRSHNCTATYVTKICAKPVRRNISRIHQKYTKLCHLNFGDLFLSVKNIHLIYVNVSVNNVSFLFASIVLLLKNTEATNLFMSWKNSKAKNMCLQELEKSIYPNYQEIASCILIQKDDLKENSQKLTTANNEHREDFNSLSVPNKTGNWNQTSYIWDRTVHCWSEEFVDIEWCHTSLCLQIQECWI